MTTPTPDYSGLTFSGAYTKDQILMEYVLASTVDSFIDQVLLTINHYRAVGRLHVKGITALDAMRFSFPPALGDGYQADLAKTVQYAGLQAIGYYEDRLPEHAEHFMDQLTDAIVVMSASRRGGLPEVARFAETVDA